MATIADLADEEYCYLTTTGRVSGLPREIEIWFGVIGDTLYMLSGNRDRSNWVRNIFKDPNVTVRVAGTTFSGTARAVDPIPDEDAAARDLLFGKYQPRYSGDLAEWRETALPMAVEILNTPEAKGD